MSNDVKEFDLWVEGQRSLEIYGKKSYLQDNFSSVMVNLRSLFKQGGWTKVRESLKIDHDYFVEFTDKDDFDSILSTESCTKTLFKSNGFYVDFFVTLIKFPDINKILSFIRVEHQGEFSPDFYIKDYKKNKILPDVETLCLEDINDYIIDSYADNWLSEGIERLKWEEKTNEQNLEEFEKSRDEIAFEIAEEIQSSFEGIEITEYSTDKNHISYFKLASVIDYLNETYNKSIEEKLIINHLKNLCNS
jgi:hypothetical protein